MILEADGNEVLWSVNCEKFYYTLTHIPLIDARFVDEALLDELRIQYKIELKAAQLPSHVAIVCRK